MDKSDSIKNIAVAMCKAQSEMGGAVKDANNPFFKSKYADLKAVVKAVKEPFSNNGLSYVQFPINDGDKIGIETILMHESGEFLSNSFTVKATKQDAQGAGSVITYCRRYGLQAVAGIPSEDDDGNAASKQQTNGSVQNNTAPLPPIVLDAQLAIENNSAKWIVDNWTSLGPVWHHFTPIEVDTLNLIFNQQQGK